MAARTYDIGGIREIRGLLKDIIQVAGPDGSVYRADDVPEVHLTYQEGAGIVGSIGNFPSEEARDIAVGGFTQLLVPHRVTASVAGQTWKWEG